jgi:two-component system, NarL family, nitrate/nitrite response regulator NarL
MRLGAEPLRCVIVDDNADFLDVASRLLERGGVAIVGVASTTAEALSRTEELRPDVTLVDVHLGAESGFELARQLHSDHGRANPAVILTSASPEQEFSAMLAASPALGFVRKGALSAGEIRRLVDTRVDGGSAQVNGE